MVKNTDTTTSGFEFTKEEVQANFSAILSVMTEQEALIAELLGVLVDKGILSSIELTKVTDVHLNHKTLPAIYRDIYKRYAHHFFQAKKTIEELQLLNEEPKE